MQDGVSRQRMLEVFERGLGKEMSLQPKQLAQIMRRLAPSWEKESDERINEIVSGTCKLNSSGAITCEAFVDWLFEAESKKNSSKWRLAAKVPDETSGDRLVQTSFGLQLHELSLAHPYLKSSVSSQSHPLAYWHARCNESFQARKFAEAQEHLRRVQAGVDTDAKQVSEAFKRFDIDSSGYLDTQELQYMCAYLGWAVEEADFMNSLDIDHDGKVSLSDFQQFVGRMGGVQKLFEQRRLRIGSSRKDVCDQLGLSVGARVRSHFYAHGLKSKAWREAQVLKVRVKRHYGKAAIGPVTYGVLLEFGFGKSKRWGKWRATQVVPPSWILSNVDDANTAAALREIGLLDEQQSFWSLLVPDSELQALQRLTSCQREALKKTRDHSSKSHEDALPKVRERFKKIGWGERELNAVLSWIQDLAPVCVHIHLDRMGKFMEVDDFYRSQFETKTSCGAGSGDSENRTRKRWETELFGGAYDDAKPFERCKYGALNVMNDYRGVVRARGYGDSYLVLKDVRLRCTFASTDSGGIQGKRLGVLDKYCHVLSEYSEDELRGLVRVAVAASAPAGSDTTFFIPQLLRGPSWDSAKDWVSIGFPSISIQGGCFFLEVNLEKGCVLPQVGLLSSAFEQTPQCPSNEGVGDDCHGWAVDGLNVGRWHNGTILPWKQVWKAADQRVSALALNDDVVVGVAVILFTNVARREIYFSTNGVWDLSEDQTRALPAFTAEQVPENVALYPAVSLKGRATFNFGPDFKHSAPPGGQFHKWPGTPESLVRVDTPHIGDENTMRIYKEVQIHGECHLGRNVQRLVACNKYKEQPKPQRSLGLRVSNAGLCNGTYTRVGARNKQALYKHDSGPCIFFEPSGQKWILSQDGSFEDRSSSFSAEVEDDGSSGPPRLGWGVPAQMKGSVPEAAFREALKIKGVTEAEQLISALSMKLEDDSICVCKVRDDTSLDAEWGKLKSLPSQELTVEGQWKRSTNDATMSIASGKVFWGKSGGSDVLNITSPTTCTLTMSGVEYTATLEKEGQQLTWSDGDIWTRVVDHIEMTTLVWDAAVDVARKSILASNGIDGAFPVIQTAHPYEARSFSWTQDYQVKNSSGLVVLFYSKCVTYDSCAEWKILSGGLRRPAAGRGARVEVQALGGGDKVWGTVAERSVEGDVWKIRLDRQQAEPSEGDVPWPPRGALVEARLLPDSDTWALASVIEARHSEDKFIIAWCAKSSEESVSWTCSRCTYLNSATAAVCAMCELPQAENDSEGSTMETCEKALCDIRQPAVKEASCLVAIRPCDHHLLDMWLTSGARRLARNSGRLYYELKLDGFFLNPQIGWLTEGFSDMPFNKDAEEGCGDDLPGVGDDEFGWACDGVRCKKWHGGDIGPAAWPREWMGEDVIGLALDIEGRTMQFSLNGEWVEAAAMSFEAETAPMFFPAVSTAGQFSMNIPRDTWIFSPPDSDYAPWADAGVFTRPERTLLRKKASEKQESRDLDHLPRYMAVVGEATCFAVCHEEPKFLQVKYSGKAAPDEQGFAADLFVGDELESLAVDRSTPLMPIIVEKFRSKGLAQKQGVQVGWHFDVLGTLSGPSRDAISAIFNGMGGVDKWENSQPLGALIDAIYLDIEEAVRRLNCGLGKLSEVTLVFSSCSSASPPTLLPEAHVSYGEGQTVGSEIHELKAAGETLDGCLEIVSFATDVGPAQTAGVRHGWMVDVPATVSKNPGSLSTGSEQLMLENPGSMLSMSNIIVIFRHPAPTPTQLFCASGSEGWHSLEIPAGDSATFQFSTDGDGGDSPERRWGVHCMLMPKELAISQEKFDEAVTQMMDIELKAQGVKGEPEVQRDTWDENRLRALCARFGWDFEWMTEDGEGRRRARERLRLAEIPLIRPSPPDPTLPDGSSGVTMA